MWMVYEKITFKHSFYLQKLFDRWRSATSADLHWKPLISRGRRPPCRLSCHCHRGRRGRRRRRREPPGWCGAPCSGPLRWSRSSCCRSCRPNRTVETTQQTHNSERRKPNNTNNDVFWASVCLQRPSSRPEPGPPHSSWQLKPLFRIVPFSTDQWITRGCCRQSRSWSPAALQQSQPETTQTPELKGPLRRQEKAVKRRRSGLELTHGTNHSFILIICCQSLTQKPVDERWGTGCTGHQTIAAHFIIIHSLTWREFRERGSANFSTNSYLDPFLMDQSPDRPTKSIFNIQKIQLICLCSH